MRYALAASLLCLSALPSYSQARAKTPAVKGLLEAFEKADTACKREFNPEVEDLQCDLRDRISLRLKKHGYCYGRDGLSLAEGGFWHPCNDD